MAYIGPKVSSILETEINWNNIKNVPASISKVFQSDGSTTEFDLGYTPLNVESVRVSVNQMLKVPYTDYNIINDTILKINVKILCSSYKNLKIGPSDLLKRLPVTVISGFFFA